MNKQLERGYPFDELETMGNPDDKNWIPKVGEIVQYFNMGKYYDAEYIGCKIDADIPYSVFDLHQNHFVAARYLRRKIEA